MPTQCVMALWHFCGKYRRLGRFCRLVTALPSIICAWIGTFHTMEVIGSNLQEGACLTGLASGFDE
jgi:hypothetical protein